MAVCGVFVACPKLGIAAAYCTSSPGGFRKAHAIGVTAIVLDMLTDLLILSIPVWVLWRIRIPTSQKFELAAFLCLSVVMIITAIIRVSGMLYHKNFDTTWGFFWSQAESCIAVTMLSLTAFGSVFVAAKPGPNNARPWVPSTRRLLGSHKKPAIDDQFLDDSNVSSETLTGLSRVLVRSKTTPVHGGKFEFGKLAAES